MGLSANKLCELFSRSVANGPLSLSPVALLPIGKEAEREGEEMRGKRRGNGEREGRRGEEGMRGRRGGKERERRWREGNAGEVLLLLHIGEEVKEAEEGGN